MPLQSVDFTIADFSTLGILTFTGGTIVGGAGFVIGNTLTDGTTGATAYVHQVNITSGTWAGGDAAGTVIIYKTSSANFGNGNTITNAAADSALISVAPVNTGNYDGRFPKMQYVAENVYDPLNAGVEINVLYTQLSLVFGDTQDDYGITLDANDSMTIPLGSNAGRRAEQLEGAFQVVAVWDDNLLVDGALRFFIFFQALQGVGDGSQTLVDDTVLSIDQSNNECGDYQPFDLSALTIRLSFDTNDTGSGGNTKSPPDNIGGGTVSFPV